MIWVPCSMVALSAFGLGLCPTAAQFAHLSYCVRGRSELDVLDAFLDRRITRPSKAKNVQRSSMPQWYFWAWSSGMRGRKAVNFWLAQAFSATVSSSRSSLSTVPVRLHKLAQAAQTSAAWCQTGCVFDVPSQAPSPPGTSGVPYFPNGKLLLPSLFSAHVLVCHKKKKERKKL